jgi:Flp pilus assembly protein TadG
MTRGRTHHRGLHDNRGAAAVEFALVVVVLLLILLGIIDFGRLLYVSQAVKSASREGARVAVVNSMNSAVNGTSADAAAAAAALAGGTATISGATCGTATCTDAQWLTNTRWTSPPALVDTGPAPFTVAEASGILCDDTAYAPAEVQSVRVRVSVDFHWLTPIGSLPLLGDPAPVSSPELTNTKTVDAYTIMRCE